MAWENNPELIVGILEEAGFDTIVTDTIQGIKEDGTSNHQVYINKKGRVRYQYSTQKSQKSSTYSLFKREFNIDTENRDIMNIIGELQSADELVKFLQSIPDIIRKGEVQ
jgi:hypothetical protein